MWSNDRQDHFYTTSVAERDNAISQLGYVSEGITGYVYPDNRCGSVPLYRSYNAQQLAHFYTISASEWDNAVQAGWVKEGIAGYVTPYTG